MITKAIDKTHIMHVHLLILLHQFKIVGGYSTNKSTATRVA